jgi:hypothetical protein
MPSCKGLSTLIGNTVASMNKFPHASIPPRQPLASTSLGNNNRQPAGLEKGATTLARKINHGIQAARGLEDEFFSLLVNRMA